MRRVKREKPNTPAGALDSSLNTQLVSKKLSKGEVEAALSKAMLPFKESKQDKEPEQVEIVKPEPPKLPAIVTNVRKVGKPRQLLFASRLRAHQRAMTSFLVMHIVPYEAALTNAVADAEEVLGIMTGAQSVSLNLGKAGNYIEHIIPETKALRWFANRAGLSEQDAEKIMNLYFDSLQPKPQSPRTQTNGNIIEELSGALRRLGIESRRSVGVRAQRERQRTATRRNEGKPLEGGQDENEWR